MILFDRKYPASGLEKLLEDVYGADRTMIDCLGPSEAGMYVGVTLANAWDGSISLATNYNGVGQRACEQGG